MFVSHKTDVNSKTVEGLFNALNAIVQAVDFIVVNLVVVVVWSENQP